MNLKEYLIQKNTRVVEGSCAGVPLQCDFLKNCVMASNVTRVLEIGFNAGHSSELFLTHNPQVHVLSFDIGKHASVNIGKEYIDKTYPGRHTLIKGDSKNTLKAYREQHPDKQFDLLFIDGGHDFETAFSDLTNCKYFAHKDTIVIMDDICKGSYGPVRAWNNLIDAGVIEELGHSTFNNETRGHAWGLYRA
jgi:predicted O-methyltransferase YrrM